MSNDTKDPKNNGAVLNIAQIIKSVVSSAAEADIGALFINSRHAIPARVTAEEMGHISNPNRQHNSRRIRVEKSHTASHQVNRHEVLVGARPSGPTAIQILLGPRQAKQCRLLDEAFLHGPPRREEPHFYDPCMCIGCTAGITRKTSPQV